MENMAIRRCGHAGALQRNIEQRCKSQTRLQPNQHAHELICTRCHCFLLLPFAAMLFHASNSWGSFSSTLSLSLSLSVCLFRAYLITSFLPRLCEIDCAPLPSADAAVIEKHTLLWPRALPLSLPDSYWLADRGDITLSPSLPFSHSLPPHAPWIRTIPFLPHPQLLASSHDFLLLSFL